MSDWKPIETAPSHEVLLSDGCHVATAKGSIGSSWYPTYDGDMVYEDNRLVTLDWEPTHWMPLPEPPVYP
jgi:hypothetical protein